MSSDAEHSRPEPVVQPVPAPLLRSAFRQLLTSSALVDRAGRRVLGLTCPVCGNPDDTYTCPGSLPCPSCRAAASQRCKRPSGHTSDTWHAARVRAADAVDQAREEADDPTLLAPWPE